MVVPSCSSCNRATSTSEQIVATLARSMREWTPRGLDHERTKKMLRDGVGRDAPEILQEWKRRLKPSQRAGFRQVEEKIGKTARPINIGYLTRAHIRVFGAKLAFALHYASAKRIVSPSGGVAVQIRSIKEIQQQQLPMNFRALLGDVLTLKQGRRFEVSDQFNYSSASDDVSSVHWANISNCFELLLFVVEDVTQLTGQGWIKDQIFQPGGVQSPIRPRPIDSYWTSWRQDLF